MSDIMLEIKDLHVHYGGIHAVKGVSLSIPRGSIVTLIGANGAGKSSVIRSVAGLVKGATGEVILTRRAGDKPLSLLGQPPESMVRHGIALSPEGRRILPHLTVAENLTLGRGAARTRRASRERWSGCIGCSRAWPNAAGRRAALCPAGNSRCWPWAGRS